MNIIGLESVIYGADDIKKAIRFQEDWGLELVEKGNSGAKFKLPDNTTAQFLDPVIQLFHQLLLLAQLHVK